MEDERHAIAAGAFNQSASRLRLSDSLRTPDNLVQPITQSALLINRVRRVTYDVHEQDMGDLELNLFLNLGGHLRATLRLHEFHNCASSWLSRAKAEAQIDSHAWQGGSCTTRICRAGAPPADSSMASEALAVHCPFRKLTSSHMPHMVCHTKTTLNIDDTVMARLRQEAARQRKTMSELVEAALRLLFHSTQRSKKKKPRPLPKFHGGPCRIDISNREQLYSVLDRERDDLYRH